MIVQSGGFKDISDAPFTIGNVVTTQPRLSDMSVTVGWNNPTLATDGSISSYPASFKFTLTAGNVPIYFKSPINITSPGQVSSISFSNELLPRITSTTANPSTLTGDGSSYFIVPAGSSRTFTVLTTLSRENAANPNGVNIAKATEIIYRTDINSTYGTPLYPVDSLKVSVDFSKPTITLLSPNGGERYTENGPMTIRWNTTGAPSTAGVLLELHYKVGAQTNDFVELIAEDVVPNTGSYIWTVPVAMSAGNNNSFTVKAILYDKSNLATDSSDAIFTIVSQDPVASAAVITNVTSAKGNVVIASDSSVWSVAHPAISFTVVNTGDNPIYISKNANVALATTTSSGPDASTTVSYVTASGSVTGDTVAAYLVNSSRTFTYNFTVDNTNGTSAAKKISIVRISFGTGGAADGPGPTQDASVSITSGLANAFVQIP